MLVIISDLHLTDGSSGEIISDSAFRLFRNRVKDMAYDASWRCDGKNCGECRDGDDCRKYYEPIKSLDIILLGDILDMIRSEKWNDAMETVMPWIKPREDDFFTTVTSIVKDILAFNQSSFNLLRGMACDGDVKIPEAMAPAGADKRRNEKIRDEVKGGMVSVNVNIYYMIGNHDWFFYIDDPRMADLRNQVIDALGLANERNKPFPYHRSDNKDVLVLQDVHRVFAEHGDEYDKTNFQTPHRDASSVGDVVVIRLLNAIPAGIKKYLTESPERAGTEEEINTFIKQLREIDNLRPYTLAPAWITQIMQETNLNPEIVNKAIGHTLRTLIRKFAENSMIASNRMLKYELKVANILFGKHFSIRVLSYLIGHTALGKDRLESYKKYAVQMAHDQDKDFFVMGHTHYAEVVPLSNYLETAKGKKTKRSKIYVNTGTWRSVHFKGYEDDSFISYKTMSIAGFFKPDERKHRPFEFWTGSLAM